MVLGWTGAASVVLLVVAACLVPGGLRDGAGAAGLTTPGWTGTWEAAPVEPATSGLSQTGFDDQTVRQLVKVSAGGSSVGLRLSGLFDAQPVTVGAAEVGLSDGGTSVEAGTDVAVTVGGSSSWSIPAGATVTTDPISMVVPDGAELVVSLWFPGPTGALTWHPDALTTNTVGGGDQVAAAGAMTGASTTTSWYLLDGVEVEGPSATSAVVAFGASTTDGIGSDQDGEDRWPDDLYRRAVAAGAGDQLGVDNAGIAGNLLLSDAGTGGQSGVDRFGRDAVDVPGAKVIIVSSLGNNDIGDGETGTAPPVTADQMIAGYQQLISQAHAAGDTIIGGTLTPDGGAAYYTDAGEAIREQVNDWILTSGSFDATVDFAAAVADPADPDRLAPAYDSGDHLHPNAAGYRAMADAVNLSLLPVTTTATVPGAPRIGEATPGVGSATVAFSAPADGGSPITGYQVQATDLTDTSGGGQRVTGPSSPIDVPGLTAGDSYSFTVTADNAVGTSAASAASDAVTPTTSICAVAGTPDVASTLPDRAVLTAGQQLRSTNGDYTLAMQSDGNLVEYLGPRAIFNTHTETAGAGACTVMQPDGNLVVYDRDNTALFSTHTFTQGDVLTLQDDSNLVVYAGARPQWNDDAPGFELTAGTTLLTGWELLSHNATYKLIMQSDGNLVEYDGAKAVFATYTTGAGNRATMQTDGNFVVYSAQGRALFNTRTDTIAAGAVLQLGLSGDLVVTRNGRTFWDDGA